MENVATAFRVYYDGYQKQIDAFAPRFRSRLSRSGDSDLSEPALGCPDSSGFIGDLSGPVGAVFNRTGLECPINSKVHHRLTQTFVYKVC